MPEIDSHDHCFSPTLPSYDHETFEELDENSLINFDSLEYLDKGGQAIVYKASAQISPNGAAMFVVLKELKAQAASLQQGFDTHLAVSAGETSTHSHHLLKLITVKKYQEKTYAVLPYCETTLKNAINTIQMLRKSNLALHNYLLLHLFANLLMAVDTLHQYKKRTHRDIKPANIGLYRNSWCLFDFDSSTSSEDSTDLHYQGTYFFSHPAAYYNPKFSQKTFNDIYALGTVLLTLLQPKFLKSSEKHDVNYYFEQYKKYERFDQWIKKSPQHSSSFEWDAYLLDTPESLYLSLIKLAKKMRSFNPNHIPPILEVRKFISKALASICTEELKTQLNSFYLLLKEKGLEQSVQTIQSKIDVKEETAVSVLPHSLFTKKESWSILKSLTTSPQKLEEKESDANSNSSQYSVYSFLQ